MAYLMRISALCAVTSRTKKNAEKSVSTKNKLQCIDKLIGPLSDGLRAGRSTTYKQRVEVV